MFSTQVLLRIKLGGKLRHLDFIGLKWQEFFWLKRDQITSLVTDIMKWKKNLSLIQSIQVAKVENCGPSEILLMRHILLYVLQCVLLETWQSNHSPNHAISNNLDNFESDNDAQVYYNWSCELGIGKSLVPLDISHHDL